LSYITLKGVEMGEYMGRCIDRVVERDLGIFGAVLIQGPKWCGKTTTAQRFASSSLSLSDPSGGFAARELARLDPARAIVGPTPRLIDEWQEAPRIWDAVRFECDRRSGEPGQFILTGSATPRDAEQPMHSGVGRISRLRMDTMTLSELGVSSGAVSLGALLSGEPIATATGSIDGVLGVADLLCRGGWPQAVGRTTDEAMRIAAAYVDGVCESDVSRTDGVRRDPSKVRALLESLARNESTLAGPRSIGRDVGEDVSRNSIARYMDALRRINVVDDIPAWHPALRSPVKLRQGAKRHLADPSLAVALVGGDPESLSSDPKTLGLLFESLALHDLKVYAAANDARLSHYHDGDDLEVDAIVHRRGGSWVAVEVKLGAPQVPEASESLIRLERKMVERGERPPTAKCVVIGYGMPAHVTPDGVLVVPIDTLGV
jgi:predicted AAA+ superfamily ATPase